MGRNYMKRKQEKSCQQIKSVLILFVCMVDKLVTLLVWTLKKRLKIRTAFIFLEIGNMERCRIGYEKS
jgi:hypothetical protein